MNGAISIAVDAMGGDYAPDVVLEGVDLALDEDDSIQVCLCGLPEVVDGFSSSRKRCKAYPASEVIAMGEHPANAIKHKKDSSIVVGCHLVKDRVAEGFFSAGSTGACLAGATLIIGRIKGVKRPGLGVVIPSYDKPTFLIDVGANADCKPDYIYQFAQMGMAYSQKILNVQDPTVGLLNIGEEETKGSSLAQSAYSLLSDLDGFKGNCEGGDLLQGNFDVVVTDGFTGNICLKTIEGTSKMLFKYVKDAITTGLRSKIGAALIKGNLYDLKATISPDAYGGSPLLGVKGTCVIGHGSSNPTAIKNGILVCAKAIREGLESTIANAMSTQ